MAFTQKYFHHLAWDWVSAWQALPIILEFRTRGALAIGGHWMQSVWLEGHDELLQFLPGIDGQTTHNTLAT